MLESEEECHQNYPMREVYARSKTSNKHTNNDPKRYDKDFNNYEMLYLKQYTNSKMQTIYLNNFSSMSKIPNESIRRNIMIAYHQDLEIAPLAIGLLHFLECIIDIIGTKLYAKKQDIAIHIPNPACAHQNRLAKNKYVLSPLVKSKKNYNLPNID